MTFGHYNTSSPQDVSLFTSCIKGKELDLFRLWKCVRSFGGYNTVCEQRLWCTVSGQLGLGTSANVAASVSLKYRKVLLPYDAFLEQEGGDNVSSLNPPNR